MEAYHLIATCCGLLALLLYSNTLDADFAYDDSRAIQKNPDLLPETPISQLFWNDFWGTPLTHSGSHKSYRPLTVLSFRINYYLAELNPYPYHVTNVILHGVATCLFAYLTRILAPQAKLFSITAPLLFATHPIHTEAVSGIVGRADIGACIFLILALLSYINHCKKLSHSGQNHGNVGLHQNSQYQQINPSKSSGTSQINQSKSSKGESSNPLKSSSGTNLSKSSKGDQSSNPSKSSTSGQIMKSSRNSSPLRSSTSWNVTISILWLMMAILFSALSMLTKELGITALAVCATYHVFVHARLRLGHLYHALFHERRQRRVQLVWSVGSLALAGVVLLGGRLLVMDLNTPDFSTSDNPAMGCDSVLSRFLTFVFLPVFNFWLLLCPLTLSFDWSMDAVPLVEKFDDSRNLGSLVFYLLLGAVGLAYICGWKRPSSWTIWSRNVGGSSRRTTTSSTAVNSSNSLDSLGEDIVIMSLAIMIFPFLPATNLFFYVGFVVAERLLYIPSMGFCLLVSWGFHVVASRARGVNVKRALYGALLALFFVFAARTWQRNLDWRCDESLFRSGIPINPPKAYGNLANILSSQGKLEEAEWHYKKALSYRFYMADTHYNLGILYQESKRYEESIKEYQLAITFRPRMALAHLNLGKVLYDVGRKEEALKVNWNCATLDGTGIKDPRRHENSRASSYFSIGVIYNDWGQYENALDAYMLAVKTMQQDYVSPQGLYNMIGEAYTALKKYAEAEKWYLKALETKPDHVPAYLTYGRLLSKDNRKEEAEEKFKKALSLGPDNPKTHQHYGQFLSEANRYAEAAKAYVEAAKLAPQEYEIAVNAAQTLRQAGRNREAESYFRQAVRIRPYEASSHSNLGAMLHVNGKYREAEACYREALRIKPDDSLTKGNLQLLQRKTLMDVTIVS